MDAVILGRGFERRIPTICCTVERLTWSAEGGCAAADLRFRGRTNAMDGLGLLRCPVEVVGASGELIWWGYVARVEVPAGPARLVVDEDRLVNRCAAEYTETYMVQDVWLSRRRMTSWAEDAASVQEYGRRDRGIRLGPATAAEAGAARDALLARSAWAGIAAEAGGVA